ncbi:MAG: DEAD/DEAH box helicase [Sulfurimonas sp.]|nr:DEAD/DEAH box helicase [Sulfurimonas sp.]MDQ7061837.1 DEAD/DEAH box helicase [Sulfurimonas sp.]
MDLKVADIQYSMARSDFERGRVYFENDYVTKCLVRLDNAQRLMINSVVEGSYGNSYTQSIDVNKKSGLNISGSCSCPVGFNCKHVVAACLEYIENGRTKIKTPVLASKKEENALSDWLDTLDTQEEVQTLKSLKENQEYFVTYRLFGRDRNQDELKFYKSKYLKNGGLGKGTQLDSYKFVDNYYFSDIKNTQDNEIASLSRHLGFNRWGHGTQKFEAAFGSVLLQDLLKTGRCYYDENKDALSFNPEVFKPQLDFKLYKGQYSLKSNIDKNYKLLNTNPPFILDIHANTVQEFDMDVSLFKKLMQSPKIEKKDIGKIYKVLGKKVPNLEIKAPRGIQTRHINVKAVPQMHLRSSSFKVDFNYDGFEVKYSPKQEINSFYEEDEKIEIQRDLVFEESIKLKIESFGFSPELKDGNIFVELKDKNRQEQLKVFKDFTQTHLQTLQKEGWNIQNIADFDLKFEASSEIVVESENQNNWFSLSFNLEFNGVSLAIAPLVSGIIEEFDNFESMPAYVNIEVEENHFVEVQTKQIAPIIKTIIELMDKKDKDDNLKVSPYDAHLIDNLNDVTWKGSREILELSKKLKDFKGIKKVEPPKALNASLREYQQDGLNWLGFLHEFKFSGILADDMGLGKTVQTLAHLSKLKEDAKLDKPALIVMPTSLIANWKNEAKKFTPNLKVLSLHGNDRADRFEFIVENDILLTTYALIIRDKELFDKYTFSYIILDEAQKIKNPRTKMAVAIKEFKSEHRLALSGTPIENHLGELWSIFSFLMPGFLDTLSFFKKYYQTPIEKEHNFSRQELLNKRIKPFMIRRTKELVASELPAKSEIIKYTQFDVKQSALYESVRVTMEEKVKQAVEAKGLASSNITMLDALLKLRQVCCDPSLLKIKEAQKVKESAKLELLLGLLDELLAEGRKILLFSQFTSMLAIIEEKIKAKNFSYTKLTGSTRDREKVIDEFSSGKADIFLISLKAGGVGLNLVAADTVIHYDPWWNPAVENQATDRAYRIGQNKAVFVYKLIVENTIEQKILELQEKKKLIQDSIYDDNKQQEDVKFSGKELLNLLK